MESSIVVTKTSWQGADSTAVTRLFVRFDDEAVPDGLDGQVLQRIFCMSFTHIAMLYAIDEMDRVVVVSGIDYVSKSVIKAQSDSMADIGNDGKVDYERLLALAPYIMLLFGMNGASGM